MARNSILIVEDDALTGRIFSDILERDGHHTKIASTGEVALKELTKRQYDLVLLDLDLGRTLDGFEALHQIRQAGNRVRVIIITGRGSPFDIERGLMLEADNYIVKPIGQIEFRARINTELRHMLRERGSEDVCDGTYEYDKFTIVVAEGRCRVIRADEEFYLAEIESKLVVRLLQNAGSVVSLPDLAGYVWNIRPPITHHDLTNIRKTIHRLRTKVERSGAMPESDTDNLEKVDSIFVSVRNQGLMINSPKAYRQRPRSTSKDAIHA